MDHENSKESKALPAKRRLVGWLRDIGLVVILIVAISLWQNRDLVPPGDPAPPLHGTILTGDPISTAQHPDSPDRVLIYFFAPWCAVCEFSVGNLDLLKKIAGTNARVLAVAFDYGGIDEVQEFVSKHGPEAVPVVLGTESQRSAFRVASYPTYYVLDREGRIAARSVGYATFLGMLWRLFLT